ncbi:hypothetical protein KR044_000308 [Drosophila immigrans]|nr:hypothetical protein KR044_000308 [Drosophila immigrans]
MQNDKYMPSEPPVDGFSSAPPEAPQHGYPSQGYPQPGYSQQGYQPQGYAQPTPPPQGFNPPPPPPVLGVVPPRGWYNRNRRNRPQSSAVWAASLIFLSGGMNIAWSIGFQPHFYLVVTKHLVAAWFIGGIIGALISGCLANKIPKKIVMICASTLVVVGGILRIVIKYNMGLLEASLYLDGIANGLVFAPTMALIGEVSWPYMRAPIAASIEQMSFILGFFINIIYFVGWGVPMGNYYNFFTSDQFHGILSAIFGFFAVIIAAFLCIESPVITLANGDEQGAIDALRRLQQPKTITTDTFAQLDEHKRYLAQNKDISNTKSILQALPAFLRLVYLRALNAMSLSSFMYSTLLLTILPYFSFYNLMWEFVIFGLFRWLGNLITSCCTESLGRKKPTLLGLLLSGAFAFGIGAMLADYPYGEIYSTVYLIIIYQIFAGLAFTPSSVYLTEAYPLGVKQHFISFTFIAEMLVFIIISVLKFSIADIPIYFYTLGILSVVGALLGIWCLPETKGTTLREAQEKFKGMSGKGF